MENECADTLHLLSLARPDCLCLFFMIFSFSLDLNLTTLFLLYCRKMVDRIINKNYRLYGPGPLARRPSGLGARPPLQGLVVVAGQAIVIALAGGIAYNVFVGKPSIKKIEDYYKENPPR